MRHTQHPSNNDVLGAPVGVSPDDCSALPITRVQYIDGISAVVSFWRPSAADLALLNAGACIRLSIWGTTHAPLCVGVDGDDDFTELRT